MPQESGTIVTIHQGSVRSHHRACGFSYPFGPQALQLTIGASLKTSSPYRHSYLAVSLGSGVCTVRVSSILTACGLQHD